MNFTLVTHSLSLPTWYAKYKPTLVLTFISMVVYYSCSIITVVDITIQMNTYNHTMWYTLHSIVLITCVLQCNVICNSLGMVSPKHRFPICNILNVLQHIVQWVSYVNYANKITLVRDTMWSQKSLANDVPLYQIRPLHCVLSLQMFAEVFVLQLLSAQASPTLTLHLCLVHPCKMHASTCSQRWMMWWQTCITGN